MEKRRAGKPCGYNGSNGSNYNKAVRNIGDGKGEGKKDGEGEMDDTDLSGAPDIGGFPGDGGGDDYDDED